VKWGLQHVKVTLEESDSGEVVVIEQSSDGRITCVPARGGKVRAANSAPRRGAKGGAGAAKDSAPAEDEHEEADVEGEPEAVVAPKAADKRKTQAKAKSAKAAKAAKKPGSGDNKSGRRDTALAWEPVRDHGYHGFAAGSGAGQFKVLIAKGSQWALFYELQGTNPKDIGCFLTERKAKEHAQKLHDAGWPESEFGPVTAGQVATACPAPGPQREQGSTPRGKRKTKPEEKENAMPTTEEKPAATPAAEPPSKGDAEKDKALLGSLKNELKSLLDEEDD
jgi:cell division septation protein DedD